MLGNGLNSTHRPKGVVSFCFCFIGLLVIWLSYGLVRPSEASPGIPVRTSPEETNHDLRIFDEEGTLCGTGKYVQTISGNGLMNVELRLDIGGDSSLRQTVEMKQDGILRPVRFVHEYTLDDTTRRYELDFNSGHAVRSDENGKGASIKEAVLQFEEAKTFAGVMLILVALNFPQDECEIELQSVTFNPEPKVVDIKMLRETTESIQIGGRQVSAVRYLVCPILPAIVKVFIGSAHNQKIWLSQSPHPRFLRFQGTIEPGGQLFRIELQKSEMASKSQGPAPS